MEQLYSMMLTGVPVPQERPAQKNESAGKDGFQKLMEQKQGSDAQARPEKAETPQKESQPVRNAEKPEQPQQAQPAPKEGRELEEQMVLAAMAMMQNPVVPAEQTEAVPEEELLAAPVEGGELISLTADAETQPGVQSGAEIPAEQLQTEAADGDTVQVQVPKEEVPQPLEAPEAPQEAEGRTVEIKVETGGAEAETDQSEDDGQEASELLGADTGAPVFKEVKAVPVKVGEAPKTEIQQPLEEQIGPKLSEALQNGETHVELQLTPEHLGKVKVEMTWKEDGSLIVELHAENRGTQSLLEKNASGLEALLGRESQQPVRVEVPRQEESQRQDLYEQQQNQHKQQERQEQRRSRQGDSENFLQQLRLGLIPMEGE